MLDTNYLELINATQSTVIETHDMIEQVDNVDLYDQMDDDDDGFDFDACDDVSNDWYDRC